MVLDAHVPGASRAEETKILSKKRRIRGWIQLALFLLFVGFVALVATQFASPHEFVDAFADAVWYWIVAAPVIFAVYFVLNALLYKLSFQAVEVETTTLRVLPVMLASIFINALVPAGGAGAAAIFVEDAVERGQSGARAMAGVILVLVADLGTTIPFVVVGLLYLHQRGHVPIYYTVGSVLFVLIVVLLVLALWLTRAREAWTERFLGWAGRLVNRLGGLFRRPNLLSESWAPRNARQFSYASTAITKHRRQLAQVLLLITFLHLVSMAGLYAIFLAFHHPVGPGVLFAGFSMSVVFYVVAVLPQGFGAVEGAMSLVLKSLGVPSALAIETATAYRVFTVWLPLVAGYLFARRMPIFKGELPSKVGDRETVSTDVS